MNEILISTPFELTGRFGGFVFTETGKRRMILQMDHQDCLLKVPRILRRRIIGRFHPGEMIRVAGIEAKDAVTLLLKRVVSQISPASSVIPPVSPAAVTVGPIRVCSKKNCWRRGGREVWNALGQELAHRGLTDRVELRQVGCLDRCKQAPNVDWGEKEYTHCSQENAVTIIARISSEFPR